MKKFLAIFLAVVLSLTATSLIVFAGELTYTETEDGSKITNVDFLDFSENTNGWAEYDSATGKWGPSDLDMSPINEETYTVNGAIYCFANSYGNKAFCDGKLYWSLENDGEVLHVKAISSSATPAIVFTLDDMFNDIHIGSEVKGQTEYAKIRIRNFSTADQITLGFTTINLNGGQAFMSASVTNIEVSPVSGEWVEYTFSMIEKNSATNYADSLKKDANGTPQSRWSTKLGSVLVFPFGYNITDGTGAYNGAEMDIDYIVFGSKDYVTNYKSALQNKEDSVKELKLVKAPDKTDYFVGDVVDLTGLQLEATYNDGSKETLTSANLSYNFNEAGASVPVTLKYGACSASYNVKVTGIESISIKTPPTSTTYTKVAVASSFVPEGLVIEAKYVDGSTAEIPLTRLNLKYDFSEIGETFVTVNFCGAQTSFSVEIINVIGIEIAPLAKQLHFGEEIADSDLTITCLYSDGSTGTLADSKLSPTITKDYSTTVPGEITVKVGLSNATYGVDCAASTTATVLAPTSIELDTSRGAKLKYNVGDNFDATSLLVNYIYEDGTKVALSQDDYKIRYDFAEPGEKTVTIVDNYANLQATLNATVEGEVISTSTSTTTTTTTAKTQGNGNTVIIIIIVVAVVLVAAVVIFLVTKKKK